MNRLGLIVAFACGGVPPDHGDRSASRAPARIPHVALGTIDMLDVAPTIARWLGVPLPTAIGAPIAPLVDRSR